MKQYETTKLFYDRYKYKVVMLNSLGHIFRGLDMPAARAKLDYLQRLYDSQEQLVLPSGFRLHPVTLEVFLENKRLYSQFNKQQDYKVRVERTLLTVYSNDKHWLRALSKIAESPLEFWSPRSECEDIISEANVIITRCPQDYEFKVTLGSSRHVDPGLASWIRANPDKAKASEACLARIERKSNTRGQYFYARDQKVLQLITLMIDKIGRVDKLIFVGSEDK